MKLVQNIDFSLAGLIVLVIVLAFLMVRYKNKSESNKAFIALVAVCIVSDTLDILGTVLMSIPRCPNMVRLIVNELDYIGTASMGLVFIHYTVTYVNRAKRKSAIFNVWSVVFLIYVFFVAGNTFGHYMAYFDEQGNYYAGPLKPVAFVMAVFPIVISLGYAFKYRWKLSTNQLISLFVFFVLVAGGSVLQGLFFPDVMIGIFMSAVSIIIIFFSMESPDFEKLIRVNEQLWEASVEAEEAKARANDANVAKSRFLANMSHEIRTPINAVIGMNEMILRETNQPVIRGYAGDVNVAAKSLLSIINDILDLSRIESGKMTIEPVEYELGALVKDIVSLIDPRRREKGLELELKINPKLPSKLFGDDIRIKQVIINLLTNAVKYTPEGKVTLSFDGEEDEGVLALKVSVEDTGMGIKEEDLHKLYVAFERIEESRNRNIEGTGLGISITSNILKLMNSTLQVNSVYGEGSNFFFTINQKIVDANPVGDIDQAVNESFKKYSHDMKYITPNANILVVDDNPLNIKVFVNLLKDIKAKIDTAESGLECLALTTDKKYDIIFMDHMMPNMDGIETLHALKNMADNPNLDTPVVVLTANAVSGAKDMYLKEGFINYLSKPVAYDKLEEMIFTNISPDLLKEAGRRKDKINPQDVTSEIPEVEGVNLTYAKAFVSNDDQLKEILKNYHAALEKTIDHIELLYAGVDNVEGLKNYRVEVHSIKSLSASVGAMQASILAKMLEDAAKVSDIITIDRLHSYLIKELTRLNDAMAIYDPKIDKIEGDIRELREMIEGLQNALGECDFNVVDEILEKIKTYEFPVHYQNFIDSLIEQVEAMDDETALLTCDCILAL